MLSNALNSKNSHSDSADYAHMQRALDLAESARYRTSPNPRVGCVLVKDGVVIGEGATQAAGSEHAEVAAIKNGIARNNAVKLTPDVNINVNVNVNVLAGATAYVTLEPCNHTGRTGPCSHALIQAKVSRVVIATLDPNPLTAGQGIATLRAAGIAVQLLTDTHNANENANENTQENSNENHRANKGKNNREYNSIASRLVQQAQELNLGFFKRMTQGLPWVRLKTASSLDGFSALANGQSQWLTGELARTDTHHWRASSCAVLTGIGTVLADNPSLTVRHILTPRQPLRVVLDTHLRTPPQSRLLQTIVSEAAPLLIVHNCSDTAKQAALSHAGAELLKLPCTHNANPTNAAIDLHALLQALAQRGINEVHCEAGGVLNGALLQANLVDEIMLYQAPLLLGAGLSWAHTALHHEALAHIRRWRLHSVAQLGDDSRMILRSQALPL